MCGRTVGVPPEREERPAGGGEDDAVARGEELRELDEKVRGEVQQGRRRNSLGVSLLALDRVGRRRASAGPDRARPQVSEGHLASRCLPNATRCAKGHVLTRLPRRSSLPPRGAISNSQREITSGSIIDAGRTRGGWMSGERWLGRHRDVLVLTPFSARAPRGTQMAPDKECAATFRQTD